jgi:hypothetical protein
MVRRQSALTSPKRCRWPSAMHVLAVCISLCIYDFVVAEQPTTQHDSPRAIRQSAFRVRSLVDAPLNADRGWAGTLNENVTVRVDQPFRIRFELEGSAGVSGQQAFRVQCRRNGGEWANVEAEDFPMSEEASPQVSIVSAGAYDHGAATTDLLRHSTAAYHDGAGVSLAATTPPWSAGNVHSEWEWPLVIRRFADNAVTSNEGDRFEFRMVGASGDLLDSAVTPEITASVPPRHLGGTFVETPGRIGPWEASNGDLYFIMEPAETDNLLMMVKSTDRGVTWQEVDGTSRPEADDLEGVASVLARDAVHVLHQTSDEVWYHSFRTSDHSTRPDAWDVRDELVATPEEPPTQVASIAARSDGSIVAFYGGPMKVHFKIRSSNGAWCEETVVDAEVGPILSGPQVAVGDGDVVHLAYTGNDGTAWYRRLQPNGTLTPRVQLTTGLGTSEYDVGSILPLVFIPETNTLVAIYRLATGRLWARRITAHGPPGEAVQVTDRDVVQNAVDSDQTGADAIAEGTTVHVLLIEQGSGNIYHTCAAGAGDWQPSRLQVDGVHAQWIRGTLLRRGRAPVLGYIYDAGSDGGSGMNQFADVSLQPR